MAMPPNQHSINISSAFIVKSGGPKVQTIVKPVAVKTELSFPSNSQLQFTGKPFALASNNDAAVQNECISLPVASATKLCRGQSVAKSAFDAVSWSNVTFYKHTELKSKIADTPYNGQ